MSENIQDCVNEEYVVECEERTRDNEICIFGTVFYRNQPVKDATVVISHGRHLVAKCITNCEGQYEFTGEKKPYFLRAYKNGRFSNIAKVLKYKNNKAKADLFIR